MNSRILSIDDSPTMRMLIRKALKEDEYEIIEAENGQEGLDLAQHEEFSLIFVDVNMPIMDGFSCVEGIRAMSQNRETPIVFLTTVNSKDKMEKGKTLGANGWIVKPFEPEPLRKLVKVMIKK
ncbi:MAG: response regulator [Spirochaetales bacterium]|nr:response regulator [Spirochaetales bacterium]